MFANEEKEVGGVGEAFLFAKCWFEITKAGSGRASKRVNEQMNQRQSNDTLRYLSNRKKERKREMNELRNICLRDFIPPAWPVFVDDDDSIMWPSE